jgi:hypothetical protein
VPQLRKLGRIFEMCSDEIDLKPASGTPVGQHSRRSPRRGRVGRTYVPTSREERSELQGYHDRLCDEQVVVKARLARVLRPAATA